MTGVGTSLPRLRRIAGPGVLAVVLVTLGTPRAPVSALEDPGLRIEPNQTIEQEYKPIVGQNPVPIISSTSTDRQARSSSVHVPSPVSSSPAASPLTCQGSSCS